MGLIRNALQPIVSPVLAPRPSTGELAPVSVDLTTPVGIGSWLLSRGSHDALLSMAYLACELAKMRPVSMLPVHVYRSTPGGREEATAPVPFYLSNLMRTRWNPFLKATDAIRWVMLTKDTLGSAFVRVEWDRVERQGMVPVAMWPMTGTVSKLWDPDRRVAAYDYSGDQFTPAGVYADREVVEFRSPLPDLSGLSGRSIAEACAAAIDLDVDLYEFYQRLITNGTHMPKWLETDEHMNERDVTEFYRSIQANTAGVEQAGFLRLFPWGVKVRQSEASMVDLNFLEESRWVLQTVCRVTGVPPNEVYDNSQLTYSGNVEMSAIQFSQKTLTPECRELETALDGILRSAGLYDTHVRFDVNGLLRGQYESRMKGYQIGIFTGFFTVDEVREWEELPKVPGGEVRMWPTNYYQVGEDGELVPPPKAESDPSLAPPGGSDGSAGDMPSQPDKALAEAAFHRQMLDRVRERFESTGDTPAFRDFAAKVLAPWAQFCAMAGVEYDFNRELEELMRP